jgi:hypothetical protein
MTNFYSSLGGPLTLKTLKDEAQAKQVGIVSWGMKYVLFLLLIFLNSH